MVVVEKIVFAVKCSGSIKYAYDDDWEDDND